jgi:hypothetical protein
MNINTDLPNPQHVLALRIHLAWNDTITPGELTEVAGKDLVDYMVREGIPESDLDEELGDFWNCRDLAKWMRDHPKLNDLYVQGKMIKNPSGRTCEINQGYRPGRI